ncbi:DUF3861 domain-containing protein [Ferrimonas senticii]|uniref:DUF3861 domain-containing protein n=1 Tax=Ferrimonas senticii TaxID=394566 RepID=UPI000427F81B|nr:DUF3861 domain-containing protein [Ferrimonas senticii]
MKGHLYQFHVEYKEDKKGNPIADQSLDFAVRNHDELFTIVEKLKRLELDKNDTAAFAFGLKLLGEVMMKNSKHELMREIRPHFREIMGCVKGRKPRGADEAEAEA